MSTAREYIVLCGQVVGGGHRPFEVIYNWDARRFRVRQAAISHGFVERGSDDFNIGVLENGKLVSLDWMDEPIETDTAELALVAESAGLV